ncbi:tetratricopeptide repeat protein [Acidihalobacter prosperus]
MKRKWVLWPIMAIFLSAGCATVRQPSSAQRENKAHHTSAAVNKFEPSPKTHAMYDVLAAEMAGHSGDLKAAIHYYRKAMKAYPDPSLAQRTMQIALFLHNQKVALEAAHRWAKLVPHDAKPQQALGILYASQGDVTRSVRHLENYINKRKGNTGQGFMRVGTLLGQAVPEGVALSVMKNLVSKYPGQPRAQFAYGVMALKLGKSKMALGAAEEALHISPHMNEALSLKAQALMSLGDQQQAFKVLKEGMARAPKSVVLHLSYARLLVVVKSYRAAREQFRWLLKRSPDNPAVLYTLGLLDFHLKRDSEAYDYLQRVYKAGYHVSVAQYFLGRIAERNGNMESALTHYANVNAGEYLFDAQVRIAYILARQGDLNQAREYLGELRANVSGRRQKIELYLVEGELLQQADDLPAAFKLYDKAVHKYPKALQLLYARALVADKLGKLKIAEKDLTRIIQSKPNDAVALNALGYVLANRTSRYDEALGYIKRALALKPHDPEIIDSMGWVQFKLKHYARALHYLEKAYSAIANPEVAGHLIQALVKEGKRSRAHAVLEKALKAYPGNVGLMSIKHQLGL